MNQERKETSRPADVAAEIERQWNQTGYSERLDWGTWDHATGKRRYLDPARAALKARIRLGDCGTYPRGRITLVYPSGEARSMGAHQCRHRICPTCGKRRGSRLYAEISPAIERIQGWGFSWDRVRFLTLTIPNTESAWEGMQALAASWHRMLANRRFSRLIAGGFRCFEVKAGADGKWNVHLHAIAWTWAKGAPYQILRDSWDKAAGAPAGTTYNQRFDELRKKAKPHKGETKASAAARYLVKYLAKWEDVAGMEKAPGGLPHLLASLEGRRMFSAWGVGAAARRINRHESPSWTGAVNRHLTGYRDADGQAPIMAVMAGHGWESAIPVPIPALPVQFSAEEIGDQVERCPSQVRQVNATKPLDGYDWRKIPTQGKDLKRWLGWEETRQAARERIKGESASVRAFRRSWRDWREENAQFETKPEAFRWGRWWKGARKSWLPAAAEILGTRETGEIGYSLWQKVRPTDDNLTIPISDPRHWSFQLVNAVKNARRTVNAQLRTCEPCERANIISRLPAHIAAHYLEEGSNYGYITPGPSQYQ